MREVSARILRALILLSIMSTLPVRVLTIWPISVAHTPKVSTHLSPPLNETIPFPVPMTVSFGYGLAPSGPQSAVVLCVEFTNLNHTKSRNEIHDVTFNKVSAYFREVSYNKISLTGSVSRWYQMNKTVGAYGRDGLNIDDPNGDGSPDSWMLIQEAIDAADPEIDFSQYSYLIVLHAGPGQETSGNPNDLWSCAYLMGVWFRTRDGISYSKAMIVPEAQSQGADTVGVVAHEFAHLLGLPDLYDPYRMQDYVGRWELMGKGLWNGNPPSSSPAHMSAWSKIRLGWINDHQIVEVSSGVIRNVTLSPIELNGTVLAVKIPIADRIYYLMELRQRIGYDLSLPDSGLLVTYVDGTVGGPGSVRIVDANPLTATLDDCTFKPGRTFTDATNKVFVSILEVVGQNYHLMVNRVGAAPDLALTKLEITPYPFRSGRILTFMFHIANQGTATASSFTVHVYLNANLLYTNTYTLEPGYAQLIQLTWNATLGKHVLKCTIDSARQVSDINRLNNEMTREFIVGSVLSVKLPWGGGTVRVNGTVYAANGTTTIEIPILPGQQTIEVPSEHHLSLGRRQVFARWGDGSTSNPRIYHATGDVTLTAEYKTQYRLTVHSGKGTTTGDGWYDENSTATAEATTPIPLESGKTRLIFSHWSGNYTSNSTTLQLQMNHPYNLTANWALEHYLTIISGVGSFAEQGWYREGTVVKLKASSPVEQGNRTRRVFTNWSGDVTSESSEVTVTMANPRTVVANWMTEYELRVLSERGRPSGGGWIPAGSAAKFSVGEVVDLGTGTRYVFKMWTGDHGGSACEASIVMNGPKTVTATWQTQYLVRLGIAGLPNGTAISIRVNSKWRNETTPVLFSEWVDAGSSLSLEALPTVHAGADQYVLQGWRNSDGQPVDLPQTINSPRNLDLVYVRKPRGLLKILIATYESDNLPEVALLELTRERYIPRTFAGRHWSEMFDQLCHSLAPNLPASIVENPTLRKAVWLLLYPTLRILALSSSAYLSIGPNSEAAFFAAGFIASSLLGMVYLSPILLPALYVAKRKRPSFGRGLPKYIIIVLMIGVELAVFGEITQAPITTTTSMFLFLIASACLSSVAVALALLWISGQIKVRGMAKVKGRGSKSYMGPTLDVSSEERVRQ